MQNVLKLTPINYELQSVILRQCGEMYRVLPSTASRHTRACLAQRPHLFLLVASHSAVIFRSSTVVGQTVATTDQQNKLNCSTVRSTKHPVRPMLETTGRILLLMPTPASVGGSKFCSYLGAVPSSHSERRPSCLHLALKRTTLLY